MCHILPGNKHQAETEIAAYFDVAVEAGVPRVGGLWPAAGR